MDFYEHKFVIEVIELLLKGEDEDPLLLHHQAIEPFEYVKQVDDVLSKIEHNLRTLMIARVFIAERHPLTFNNLKSKSSISTTEYLRYHIEAYFLRTTIYKDQVLTLYSIVHQIDAKQGLGFESRLRKKLPKQLLEEYEEIINSIDAILSKVKPIRNLIAHEGLHHIRNFGIIDAGNRYLNEPNTDKKLFSEENWNDLLKGTIMENIMTMMDNEKEMATNLFWVLDQLYPYFSSRIKTSFNKME